MVRTIFNNPSRKIISVAGDESTNERSKGVQYWCDKMRCDVMPKNVDEAFYFMISALAVCEVTFKFNRGENIIETDMYHERCLIR